MPPLIPGELLPEPGEIVLNASRPVQMGCHFHFHEANSALNLDRDSARVFGFNGLVNGPLD